ncbi:MAG: DUF4292 domain-containing protein [Bacteroidales bacterium]|nr:DUF4292 domain-containing protein [Bacteroidales bacterium]
MRNLLKIKNILVLLLIISLFAACKTSKSIPKQEQPMLEADHTLTPSEMVMLIQKNQPAFRTANASKMSIFVDFKERQLDVKASCKIVSDSAIHLSIQPFFGVELFKLEMTPTEMLVIDKANKRYYQSNYGIFKSRFGVIVNYDAIQSLISNRLFVSGKRGFSPDDFSWKTNDSINNTLHVQAKTMYQEVAVDLALGRIAEVLLQTNDNSKCLKTSYSNFKDFDGFVFPEKINIDGVRGTSKALFHFTVEEVKFDVPIQMKPMSLSRYGRGDINALFRK